MKTYTKKEAIHILTNIAKDYEKHLINKNFLFIYKNRQSEEIEFFETLFTARNFQHLTGIEFINFSGQIVLNHIQFYKKCVHNKLSESEIRFKQDGTTHLKLQALPQITHFMKFSKMTALYNNLRPKLALDRLAGTTNFCLGFKYDNRGYYAPCSSLLEDIRNLTNEVNQILIILSKPASKSNPFYADIQYMAKGISLKNIVLPLSLKSLITPELLIIS